MVMPIMTQTLPTIIGAGVVSRTTETLFDKHGRRIKSKGKSGGRAVKVHKGPRGGKYVIRKGRKVYI